MEPCEEEPLSTSCYPNMGLHSSSVPPEGLNHTQYLEGELHEGDAVSISGTKLGTLMFLGHLHLARDQGIFCGVELEEPVGNHDGELDGIRYFRCKSKHGIFAPISKVTLIHCSHVDPPLVQRQVTYSKGSSATTRDELDMTKTYNIDELCNLLIERPHISQEVESDSNNTTPTEKVYNMFSSDSLYPENHPSVTENLQTLSAIKFGSDIDALGGTLLEDVEPPEDFSLQLQRSMSDGSTFFMDRTISSPPSDVNVTAASSVFVADVAGSPPANDSESANMEAAAVRRGVTFSFSDQEENEPESGPIIAGTGDQSAALTNNGTFIADADECYVEKPICQSTPIINPNTTKTAPVLDGLNVTMNIDTECTPCGRPSSSQGSSSQASPSKTSPTRCGSTRRSLPKDQNSAALTEPSRVAASKKMLPPPPPRPKTAEAKSKVSTRWQSGVPSAKANNNAPAKKSRHDEVMAKIQQSLELEKKKRLEKKAEPVKSKVFTGVKGAPSGGESGPRQAPDGPSGSKGPGASKGSASSRASMVLENKNKREPATTSSAMDPESKKVPPKQNRGISREATASGSNPSSIRGSTSQLKSEVQKEQNCEAATKPPFALKRNLRASSTVSSQDTKVRRVTLGHATKTPQREAELERSLCNLRKQAKNLLTEQASIIDAGFVAIKYMTEDLNVFALHDQIVPSLERKIQQLEHDIANLVREKQDLENHYKSELSKLEERMTAEKSEAALELKQTFLDEREKADTEHQTAMAEIKKELDNSLENGRRTETILKKTAEELHSSSLLVAEKERELLVLRDRCDELKSYKEKYLEAEDLYRKSLEKNREKSDEQIHLCKRLEDQRQEIKSLEAVVEMRNDEIRHLREENHRIEPLKEEIHAKQEKCRLLEQKNEELKEYVDKQREATREWSTDKRNWADSYEQEAEKNKRLSQKNEQLEYQLEQMKQEFAELSMSAPSTPGTSTKIRPLSSASGVPVVMSQSTPGPPSVSHHAATPTHSFLKSSRKQCRNSQSHSNTPVPAIKTTIYTPDKVYSDDEKDVFKDVKLRAKSAECEQRQLSRFDKPPLPFNSKPTLSGGSGARKNLTFSKDSDEHSNSADATSERQASSDTAENQSELYSSGEDEHHSGGIRELRGGSFPLESAMGGRLVNSSGMVDSGIYSSSISENGSLFNSVYQDGSSSG